MSPIGIAMIAIFLWTDHSSWKSGRLASETIAYTRVGEIQNYELPDQSQITIAGDSVVKVSFDPTRRELLLDRGEAFFDVQADSGRPFVVRAGQHRVTVTGTKFNVNYDDVRTLMEVAVEEGTVLVTLNPNSKSSADQRIEAGQVVLIPLNGPLTHRRLSPSQASAWRRRELFFEEAQLSEVLTEVNRYSVKPIVTMNRALDELTLTGRFGADDIDSVLYSLAEIFGLTVRETPDRWELELQ